MRSLLVSIAVFYPILVLAQVGPVPIGAAPPVLAIPASAVTGGGSASKSLIPSASQTLDLGTASLRWRTGYFGTLDASQPTITADAPALNIATTWNNAGVAFTGIRFNAVNTASLGTSLPLDLQIGGSTVFNVNRAGVVNTAFFQPFSAGSFFLDTAALTRTDPTISSGFGTSPSITAANGTAAFTINVGTGGTASSGVLAMPTATTGWACHVENITGTLGNVANQRTVVIGTTTTTVTVENQTISTGAVAAWAASSILLMMCLGL